MKPIRPLTSEESRQTERRSPAMRCPARKTNGKCNALRHLHQRCNPERQGRCEYGRRLIEALGEMREVRRGDAGTKLRRGDLEATRGRGGGGL